MSKWRTIACEECGTDIHVHEDWDNPPRFCQSCKAAHQAKWYDKRCEGCGASMHIHRDWDNPPKFCQSCKTAHVASLRRGQKQWVDKSHYRVTSADGRKSWLYETDGWTSTCIEVADHYPDETTVAYEADSSVIGQLFHGGKRRRK